MRFQFHEFSSGGGVPEGPFEITESYLNVRQPDVSAGQTFKPFITHKVKYLDGAGEEKEWGIGLVVSVADRNGAPLGIPSEDGENPAIEFSDASDPDNQWPEKFGFIISERPLAVREDDEYGIAMASLLRAGFDLERITNEGVGALVGLKGEWGQHTYKQSRGRDKGKDVTIAIFGKLDNAGAGGGAGQSKAAKAAPGTAAAKAEAAADDLSDEDVENIKALIGEVVAEKGPAPAAVIATGFFVRAKTGDFKANAQAAKAKALALLKDVTEDEPLDAGAHIVVKDGDKYAVMT